MHVSGSYDNHNRGGRLTRVSTIWISFTLTRRREQLWTGTRGADPKLKRTEVM